MTTTFRIYDDGGARNCVQRRSGAYVLAEYTPDGMGYRYSLSDGGVAIASGWLRVSSELQLRIVLKQLVQSLHLDVQL